MYSDIHWCSLDGGSVQLEHSIIAAQKTTVEYNSSLSSSLQQSTAAFNASSPSSLSTSSLPCWTLHQKSKLGLQLPQLVSHSVRLSLQANTIATSECSQHQQAEASFLIKSDLESSCLFLLVVLVLLLKNLPPLLVPALPVLHQAYYNQ